MNCPTCSGCGEMGIRIGFGGRWTDPCPPHLCQVHTSALFYGIKKPRTRVLPHLSTLGPGLAPFRRRGEGSALSALDREPGPPIGTGTRTAKRRQTVALSDSRFAVSSYRGSYRNGLRCSEGTYHHPCLQRRPLRIENCMVALVNTS